MLGCVDVFGVIVVVIFFWLDYLVFCFCILVNVLCKFV